MKDNTTMNPPEKIAEAVYALLGDAFQRAHTRRGRNGINAADSNRWTREISDELLPAFFEKIGANSESVGYLKPQIVPLIQDAVGGGGAAEPGRRKGLFGSREPASPLSFFKGVEHGISAFVRNAGTTLSRQRPSLASPTSPDQQAHYSPQAHYPGQAYYPPQAHYPSPQTPPVPPAAPRVVDTSELLQELTRIEQQVLPAASMDILRGQLGAAVSALGEIDPVITKAEKDFNDGIISGPELSDKLRSIRTQMAVTVYEQTEVTKQDITREVSYLPPYEKAVFEKLREEYCPYGTIPELGNSNHPADAAMKAEEMAGILKEGHHVIRGGHFFKVYPCTPTSAAQAFGVMLQEETQHFKQAGSLDVTLEKEAASEARMGVIEGWLEKENRLPPEARNYIKTAIVENKTALEDIKSQQLFSQSEITRGSEFRGAVEGIKRNLGANDRGERPQDPSQERGGRGGRGGR